MFKILKNMYWKIYSIYFTWQTKKETKEYEDKYEFIYEYNSNNQPLTCTSKIYSSGVLLRATLSTFYYYQGDVIPN